MKRIYLLVVVWGLSLGWLMGQTMVYSMQHGGVTRSYRLYVPPNYTGSVPVPLVFNLHGYTSNAAQQELYSGMNAVADTAGFIVCYPDGLNNSWNSGFWLPYNSGTDDVGFISALIDLLATAYNVNLARVYACGMSNGGYMSFRLACDLDERIAAVASVTGSMTTIQASNCTAARAVPVCQIHGDDDQTVPYEGANVTLAVDSVLRFWRVRNGCMAAPVYDTLANVSMSDSSWVSTQLYGGCNDGTEVLHYKVHNGGHTWPGTFALPGQVTNQDMKATREIWRFFYQFEHPSPGVVSVKEGMKDVDVGVWPNPTSGDVWVRGGEGAVEVWDVMGRRVDASVRVEGDLVRVGLGGMSRGVYVVRVNGVGVRVVRE